MPTLDTQYQATNAFLQTHAENALREASNAARRISAGKRPDLTNPRLDIDLDKPTLEAPPKFSDLFPDADDTSQEVTRLNTMVDQWLADYFPSIEGCLQNVPDDWLCGVISGTNPFGLPESVFEAIWHGARDREERNFRSEEGTIRAEFSSRGFSIPPGALVSAVEKSRQRAAEAVQEVNRQAAIRNEEVKVQLLQLAVQEATRYKLGIMSSLADFYRTWVTLPNKEIEKARVRAQAYNALYSALGAYYNVEVAFEELRLRAKSGDVDAQISSDQNKIALFSASNAASGLGQAVRGFADISGQAAGSAGSLIAQIEGL